MLTRIIWLVATILIIICGTYFTFKLRFIQFDLIKIFKSLFIKNKNKETIKPIDSLMMVLAGRIGVGSIAGVALSIYYGGIGSVFWMWISSILGASLTFVETILGLLYQKKDIKNICKGGPSYYIKYGLNKKALGTIYAVIILIIDIIGFISIQTNTITHSVQEIINIDSKIIGIILCIFVLIIIIGGVKRIVNFSSKMVPIMTLLYILVCLFIILTNINKIPSAFIKIFKSAFNFKSLNGGIIGSIMTGMQRGIFSSEAGIGTGAIASSTTETFDNKEKTSQAYIQMLGIYITTFLICTSTALVILISKLPNLNINDFNGIELVQLAFVSQIGSVGNYFVFIIILLFAFTTILSSYYNGESSLKYFIEKPNISLKILKIITLVSIFIGATTSSDIIWNFIDIFVGLLAIINIYSLIKLKEQVLNTLKDK